MRVILDTNVIIRCVLGDDPIQSPKAFKFVATAISKKRSVYVPDAVILESIWVLERRYAVPRDAIATELSAWIRKKEIHYDHRERLLAGLLHYENSKFSITDSYLAAAAQEAPNQQLATFDDALRKAAQSAAID